MQVREREVALMGVFVEDRNTILLESVFNQLLEALEHQTGMFSSTVDENIALTRGREIFDVAITFCHREHQITRDGLSGGYIASVFVRALEFGGDLDDLAECLNDYRHELMRIIDGDPTSDPDKLISLLYRLLRFLSKEIGYHERERSPQHWRL